MQRDLGGFGGGGVPGREQGEKRLPPRTRIAEDGGGRFDVCDILRETLVHETEYRGDPGCCGEPSTGPVLHRMFVAAATREHANPEATHRVPDGDRFRRWRSALQDHAGDALVADRIGQEFEIDSR